MVDKQIISPKLQSEDMLCADCVSCCNLHLDYIQDCYLLEQAESAQHQEDQLSLVQARLSASREVWIVAADSVMRTPSQSARGLRAKALVLKGMLSEVADDNLRGVSAALMFIDEVERVLGDNP